MNCVQLTGRLTKDPEVKYTDGGNSVAHFTLAVNRRYQKDNGPSADFIRCVAFGKTAEFIERYFSKGQKMDLNGRIQTGQYKNKDGVTVFTTDIVVENVEFGESKASQEGRYQGGGMGQPGQYGDTGFMDIPNGLEGEELPF